MLIVRKFLYKERTDSNMVVGIAGEVIESWFGYEARSKKKNFSTV
jgi:hypothetical protein